MAYSRLDQTDEARRWYDRGIQSTSENRQRLELYKNFEAEILRFQAEAAQVLAMKEPQ